jgi:hypothetical protein
MSVMQEIRAVLGRASGPMRPKDVLDQLETDTDIKAVCDRMNQAANNGQGLERHDDGTYSLIPGWKPTRGPGSGTQGVPDASPRQVVAAKGRKAKPSKADGRKAASKPKRAYVRKAKAPSPAPVADATRRTPNSEDELVPVRRGTLRALVHSVLESDSPVTPELRNALIQLTSVA